MFTQVHCNVATPFGTYRDVAENVWREFGSWLRSQREAARLSQSGAAQRAEIDRQQWYRIENGLSGTKRETVIRLAKAVSANTEEALSRAGFSTGEPKARPKNLTELLEALERLGVEHIEFFDRDKMDSATPEELQKVLDSIKLAIELTLRRRNIQDAPHNEMRRE